MILNTIFHQLRGKTGDKFLIIDVGKVLSVSLNERLFMIFDKDCPYELDIKYNEPKESIGLVPVLTTYGFEWGLGSDTDLIKYINVRYKSKLDLEYDQNQILKKQKFIEGQIEKIRQELKLLK